MQDEYDSIGNAQVSDIEMETPYGEEVPEKNPRKTGLGLRDGPCDSGCKMDQDDPDVAVLAMRRRLNLRLDVCVQAGCTTTDMFIVAALSADEQIAPSVLVGKNGHGGLFRNPTFKSSDPQTTLVDWQRFIDENWQDKIKHDHVIELIHTFQAEVLNLQQQNHYAPDVNGAYITGLK